MTHRDRFWMGNPYGNEQTEFQVQADGDVLAYLETLPQVMSLYHNFPGQVYVMMSRQYDTTEAWCDIYDALTHFVRSEALLTDCFPDETGS